MTDFDGAVCKVGFYTTRFIKASNEKEAEALAVKHISQEPKVVQVQMNSHADPPLFIAEEVDRADEIDDSVPIGLVFFKEGT